ncbi:MAG: NADPH-dependent FMN reductase [Solirubrobacteraceae bacterium]
MAVVIGSNRPRRICTGIAAWVQRALSDTGLLEAELVDLQELDLPFLDEPIMASQGHYEHEHTVRWSELVCSYDGFVFVFPQYNWGYPAVLKNALDFLYHEWGDKPAGLVTYGTRGGGLAATQLKQVLQGLHMRSTETNIELKTNETVTSDDGNFHRINAAFADYLPQATALASELNHLVDERD